MAKTPFFLPLVIAVTGHRDLVPAEIGPIRERVRLLFLDLIKRYPDRLLSVMSSLAEGADQLVAEIARELGIDLVVPLPMPKELFRQTFGTPESRASFDALYLQATESFELPIVGQASAAQIAVPGVERDRQYAQLGVFLCAHCHILLALWDGKPGCNLGGTGQVVRFHHDDLMPGYTSDIGATQQTLVDDESDLVYHIVCSRARPDGAPRSDLKALDASWFTKDPINPRSKDIPIDHQVVFQRASEFSRDAMRFADQIQSKQHPLTDEPDAKEFVRGARNIERLFGIADWLAIHYQRKTLITLRVTHFLAFLMGFMFILYSDFRSWKYLLVAFLVFFVAAASVQRLAKRRGWHRKYLDYRALAEGLRVQFYLAVAGATNKNSSKFAHDNFLQTQDPEVGWIRNVMRAAGTLCDAAPSYSLSGLEFALRQWIGDSRNGQLGYYTKRTQDRTRGHNVTERLGQFSLMTSVLIVALFVFAGSAIPENLNAPLVVVMGTTLLAYAVRHGYAHSTGEKELIKQYSFMLHLFSNARRRLDNAGDVAEQRQILLALGGAALDEHAEWTLMHRERSVDPEETWRIGSGG